jgi:hypothetical protein
MYESFRKYQTDLLKQFDVLAEEYKFEVIDASADVRTIFEQLRDGVSRVLTGEPLFSIPKPKPAEQAAPETPPKPKPAEEEAHVAAEKTAKSAPAPEVPAKPSEAAPAHEGTPHRAESRAAPIHEEKPVAQAFAKAAEGDAST